MRFTLKVQRSRKLALSFWAERSLECSSSEPEYWDCPPHISIKATRPGSAKQETGPCEACFAYSCSRLTPLRRPPKVIRQEAAVATTFPEVAPVIPSAPHEKTATPKDGGLRVLNGFEWRGFRPS